MSTLPSLPYSHKDAEVILADLKTQLPVITEGKWRSQHDADPGYALIKAAAALYDMTAFFCDQMVAETFLTLAIERESVVRRAKELGYIPRKATPSSCIGKITFPAFNDGFTIPANTSWSLKGMNFVCREPIEILSGQTEAEFVLEQGTSYVSTFTAPGTSWFTVLLPVNASNIVVKVNGEEWEAVDTFIGPPHRHCYKVYEDVGGQTIMFGADITVDRPISGDSIEITAVVTDGLSGNIYANNQNLKPVSVIRDAANNTINGVIKGINITDATGGSDIEDIDSIRQNAPRLYGTGGRFVTAADYEAGCLAFPGLKDVRVTGGEKLKQYRKVFVTCYFDTPYAVSDTAKAELLTYLESKAVLGIQPVVQSPVVAEVVMTVVISVENASDESIIEAETTARAIIVSYFDAFRIETPMSDLELNSVLKAIPGIKFANINFSIESFATSQAGLISIPLVSNFDVTDATLLAADETVLASGDLSEYVTDGVLIFVSEGLPTQKCTVKYKTTTDNIEPSNAQVLVLKSLTVTGDKI